MTAKQTLSRLAQLLAFATMTLAAPAAAASAEALPQPAWDLSSLATPTNFKPGDSEGDYTYDLRATNVGAKATDGSPITITDTLPVGVAVVGDIDFRYRFLEPGKPEPTVINLGAPPYSVCDEKTVSEITTVTCTLEELIGDEDKAAVLEPLEELRIVIHVSPLNVQEGDILENQVEVQGGGASTVSASFQNEASNDPAPGGFSYYSASLTDAAGQSVTQAGSHPYQFTTDFALNTRRAPEGSGVAAVPAGGDVKDIRVALPPGLIGNPAAIDRCTAQQFSTVINRFIGSAFYNINACPNSSAVGMIMLKDVEGQSEMVPAPIYNLVPPPGMPAQLGFQYANLPFYLDGELVLREDNEYGLVGVLRNLSQAKRVTAARTTIWGVPGDEIHDPIRGTCLIPVSPLFRLAKPGPACESGLEPVRPFWRLPTNCASPMDFIMSFTNWTHPEEAPIGTTAFGTTSTGCDQLAFEPTLNARPSTNVADSPSGLHVNVFLPQKEHEVPAENSEADLKDTILTLPKGLVINPAGANGLDACTPAQVGLKSKAGVTPPQFSSAPAQCPAAARIGKVQVDTPLLPQSLPGDVYVASPFNNPFGTLLAIYITVNDPVSGIVVKLAGKVDPDPRTGQITASVLGAPQTPFENFRLDFFEGAGAALRTPAVCGAYSSDSILTPWSAPQSGPPVVYSDPYAITAAPGGGSCPTSPGQLPNSPFFDAGTMAPIAGAYSPFVLRLNREDGSQEFSSISVTPPPGLVAKFAGTTYCSETALDAARGKSGREELAHPSCPASSDVGSVNVGVGAGPSPYYATGKAYLAGAYKGAPLSLAIVTPAVAGPYDLGTVVVRSALQIEPETARITAVSDPIPSILAGIPLDVRKVLVKLDRPDFTLNPTNCDPMTITGQEVSVQGSLAPLATRFQVGECKRLNFAPRLSLNLRGGTRRSDHPKLRSEVVYPKKGAYANVAKARVTLPPTEQIDNAHIQNPCTRVQFAAKQCPAGSVLGYAKAITPLFEQPLEGPVYFRSNGGERLLPDIVADLNGQVHVVLVGAVDAKKGRIRTTFQTVPDAPVSSFVLTLKGGKKGLLVNNRDICAHSYHALVEFEAQNGKVADTRPQVKAQCPKKHRTKKR